MHLLQSFDSNNNELHAKWLDNHILHVVGDPVGGIRLHIHTLIKEQEKHGIRISYAYSISSVDSVFSKDIESICLAVDACIPMRVRKKPHYSDLINLKTLYQYIKANNVTIVHGHGAKGGLYARLLSAVIGVKSVYTPHGGTAHKMFNQLEEAIYTTCENALSYFTGCYIFESYYTKDSFRNKLGLNRNKWKVIPNGIDAQEFRNQAENVCIAYLGKQTGMHLGVFGVLRSEKGQAYLISAVCKLIKSGYDLTLHVFGDGPDREELKGLVEKYTVNERVHFYGDVPSAAAYMSKMDLVVIPSLYESFGYVAVEAMLLNKFIVASRVGGLVEVLRDWECKLFVNPRDIDELAAAIVNFIDRDWLSVSSRSTCVNDNIHIYYSAERMAFDTFNVYLELLNK